MRATGIRLSAPVLTATVAAILVGFAVVKLESDAIGACAIIPLVILMPIEASLGLFGLSVPFDTVLTLDSKGTTVSWAAGAFAGIVLLGYALATGRFRLSVRPLLWWGLFTLWTVASSIWAINPEASLQQLPTIICLFALYCVAVSVRITSLELSRIASFIVVGGTIAASTAIYQAQSAAFVGRATLSFGNRESNPNDFAVALLLPFAIALATLIDARGYLRRVMLFASVTLITAAVFFSMSRTALVALAAVVFVLLVEAKVRRRILLPAFLVVIPLLYLLPNMFYERMGTMATDRGTGRLDIFIVGLQIVKESPIAGVGAGNFTVAYDRFAGAAPIFRGYGRAAHDSYLQVWAETGLIGLALLITAIFRQMKLWQRKTEHNGIGPDNFDKAAQAACWGLLVAGLAGNIQWSKAFWLALIFQAVATLRTDTESCVISELRPSHTERGRNWSVSVPQR